MQELPKNQIVNPMKIVIEEALEQEENEQEQDNSIDNDKYSLMLQDNADPEDKSSEDELMMTMKATGHHKCWSTIRRFPLCLVPSLGLTNVENILFMT